MPAFDSCSGGESAPNIDRPAEERGQFLTAEIDRELQAAIEYKIAMDGTAGAERVLDYLNQALRRRLA
ncbi:hypothetical protein RDV64_13895 [Acuticoccus sp. MNP-M23]|uniref:hypothetical protein n=1 Tax=Acuticoccus sp. MNP-M23 TaxID=3072793 RepID=UPI00281522C6|nr:hypothetical protein [Acuticoccus sp. MNP-M23]WMS41172.1 hypothetical protein RDV64_13895 [Acuticoccus sp. MNP-M23]